MRVSILLLSLSLVAAGCKSSTPTNTKEPVISKTERKLIPREVLFADPNRAGVQLSPDGNMISYLAPSDGVLNVWVAPRENLAAAKVVTSDKERPIRSYFWTYDNEHIVYSQDKAGDEDWHLYSVNLKTNKTVDLTPFKKVSARVAQVSHKFPSEVLVAVNNRVPALHDIHRVDVRTGERSLVLENPGFMGFVIDSDFNVRFGMKMTKEGGTETHKYEKQKWKPFLKVGMKDAMTTSIAGFNTAGDTLYMIDSRDRNTAALMQIDPKTGKSKLLIESPKADISGVFSHPKTGVVQAASFTHIKRDWAIIDEELKDDKAALQALAGDNEFAVTDRTLDDKTWMIAVYGDDMPVKYYLWDVATKQSTYLFDNRKDLSNYNLNSMHSALIKSRDGMDLVSYYTLPKAADKNNDGKPETATPMVLLVHGGPWARDNWGYNPLHQLLSDRGYAVLSVNFRGSTGFGKEFINAANKEWAGKMHNDLLDAVSWSTKQGISKQDKICIMGGSYGGYATLVGLTKTPEVFACGVDIVGPSNLITLVNAMPKYWKPMADMLKTRVGDWTTEEGKALLKERSPLTHADKITKPLLIGQGANDPRVTQIESDQIVAKLQENNIPVSYALFPDEGHGFQRRENRMAFFAITEAFLAEHLGGDYQSLKPEDFTGSTLQVKAGRDGIPSLPASVGN